MSMLRTVKQFSVKISSCGFRIRKGKLKSAVHSTTDFINKAVESFTKLYFEVYYSNKAAKPRAIV